MTAEGGVKLRVVPIVADEYEVKGVLGEGGTGIVYDAVRHDRQRAGRP